MVTRWWCPRFVAVDLLRLVGKSVRGRPSLGLPPTAGADWREARYPGRLSRRELGPHKEGEGTTQGAT
jgi:hypothetical protein